MVEALQFYREEHIAEVEIRRKGSASAVEETGVTTGLNVFNYQNSKKAKNHKEFIIMAERSFSSYICIYMFIYIHIYDFFLACQTF